MAFKGSIAEIPVGIQGLVGSKNISEISPGHLLVADNITYEAGTIGKEGGSAKYNSSAISGAPEVLGGIDWYPTDSTQRMVVLCDDGKLYKDSGDGSFPVELDTGLTVSNINPMFVEGGAEVAANNRKLFCLTGTNAIQVLSADGASTADLSTPPADWSGSNQPSCGAIHEGRFVGAGNLNDPHRVYFSLATDHEDFTSTALSISVYPGEGQKIVSIASIKGFLIVWKFPRGIYAIDSSNSDTSKWRAFRLTGKIGGVSPLGFAFIEDDLIFMDPGGNIHRLSAVEATGSFRTSAITDKENIAELLRTEVNLAQLSNTQAIFYAAKREAHFTLASSGTVFDRRLVVDFNSQTSRFRLSSKDTNRSIWLRQDSDNIERPTTGDQAGFVWSLDQETRSKDGSGYQGQFQTSHTDMSFLDPNLAVINKNARWLELVVEPKGNWDLSVDILWDDVISDTVTFNMGTAGASLGSFVLGTDKLAGTNLVNKRRRVVGSGRRLSLVGRNNGAGEDFSVSKFFLGFVGGSDRG